MTDDRDLSLGDLADELCDTRMHVERIPYWDAQRNRKHHVYKTTMPGLLTQMADLFQPVNNPDGGTTASVSKPPANWAALADHTVITLAVAKWCWDLRLDQRDTVEGNIRHLVGASGNLDSTTRTRLTKDMHRWHRIASTVTGWRIPPAEVRAPCPALTEHDNGSVAECKARTLRVNLDKSEAYCATCGTVWSPEQIGLLAETVRAYNRATDADRDAARARARAERAKDETAA